MPKLSIVIPVYYNAENLPPLYDDLKEKILDRAEFEVELLLVDDGSGDNSYAVMQDLARRDSRIRLFKLSRNFGSDAAVLCGLNNATGDCAVVKAADLQEPTEMILDMYKSWQSGNNVVLAVREGREESKAPGVFCRRVLRHDPQIRPAQHAQKGLRRVFGGSQGDRGAQAHGRAKQRPERPAFVERLQNGRGHLRAPGTQNWQKPLDA